MRRPFGIAVFGVLAFGALSTGCSTGPSLPLASGLEDAAFGSGTGATGSAEDSGRDGGLAASAAARGSPNGGSDADATSGRDGSGASSDGGRSPDATVDVAFDAGIASGDAGLCANQSVWLTPMNAVRDGVDAGEPHLVCDPIAAQVALAYASKCTYAHNMNRNAEDKALGGTAAGVGENIAAGAPTESIQTAVASWINEEAYYDHATNTCAAPDATPALECGHYTQIVWKTTTGVGCAHVSCTTNSPFGGEANGKWDYSVCDFSPPGNIIRELPSGAVPEAPY
jgi:hypothetical protein